MIIAIAGCIGSLIALSGFVAWVSWVDQLNGIDNG